MADTVITVENLSKRYHLGMVRHDTLRDRLAHALQAPIRRARGIVEPDPTEFWALRDVSFEVKRGEVLGIIGRNGAGKSTLLKILSRITEPTSGSVRIRGRVASLLEVGTGFHPELSGRENVFLNGAILGMSRTEIRRKFDEIVAFAEVEKFIDTPVKHYSSGMYVRLAFAVAAHLEPEILIVDEVLAVGDAAFQKKCLGKMENVATEQHRAILFVSHNMAAVQQLCSRTLLLQDGSLVGNGEPRIEIQRYLQLKTNVADARIDLAAHVRAKDLPCRARIIAAEFCSPHAPLPWTLTYSAPIHLRIELSINKRMDSLELGLGLFNPHGHEIVSTLSTWDHDFGPVSEGRCVISVEYGPLELAPGSYNFGVGVKSHSGLEDYIPEAFSLQVIAPEKGGLRHLGSIRGAIAHVARYDLRRFE